ncbi:tRNA dihydrouridine synthase DusB [Candidatus Latescibacterota bacterium]
MAVGITDIFIRESAALAPLAGITGSVFRRICVRFGARPVITEMISADGFIRSKPGGMTSRLLRFHESERPIGFQFFGSDPDIMAEAARKSMELQPDFIDINAGCPMKKIIAKGSGAALLTSPELLRSIVEKVTSAVTVPLTVKIRSGWDHTSINAVEVARLCEGAGANAIIIHPRVRSQGFSGAADWSIIGAVKKAVAISVIGSGDIRTPDDAATMLEQTGADAVMIGRRAMGDPDIFRRVAERLRGALVSEEPGIAERLELALTHMNMLANEISERYAVLNMRKFFGWYSRGAHEGADFRRKVFRAGTIDDVRRIVRNFQAHVQEFENNYKPASEMVKS